MAEAENPADLTALTVELLSAYLANNTVGSEDLPRLIRETRLALSEDTTSEPVVEEEQTFTPAVSIRKSQSSSAHLLSLIDGKPYKTLKRHLAANGLTPETYRERYKLPATYPMVAPDFAAKRRAIAEQIGLGNRPKAAISDDNQKSVAAASKPAAESTPSSVDTPTLTSPGSKDTPVKSSGTVARAKQKASPKLAKAKGDVPVVAALQGDNVASVEPVALKANAKPKSGSNSGSTSAVATSKERAARKGTKPDAPAAMPAPIAAVTPTAAPAPAPQPARKPRGKLGLFGKEKGTSGEGAPAAGGETVSEPVQATKPGKAPRSKRMARAPKAATNDAG